MELLKETKTYRTETESEAIRFINSEKENANGYVITKSGYTMKTKKSKGEIVEAWFIVVIEYSYEV